MEMEYLRAIIQSDTRGPLFKKDFEVQKVFDTFVHLQVSSMINTGELYEGEYYQAFIIPGYGQYQRNKQKRQVDKSGGRKKPSRWITLRLPEQVQPDKQMDFFTLELHLADRPFVLSENFLIKEIDYFWFSLERALEQIKVLEDYQEKRQRRLFVCKDDAFDFDREELYMWQEEANELIEIVNTETPTTDLIPQAALKDFPVMGTQRMLWGKLIVDEPKYASMVKELPPIGMQILIVQSALESIQEMARSHVEVEIGGMLIGHIYENTEAPGYLVEITDHIPAKDTLASEVELRITFETWQQQSTLLKEQYPGKRIIGWYHTHLDLVMRTFHVLAYEDQKTQHIFYNSPIFLSQDDYFTHRQFFREKWYLAMVLDSLGNLVFYQWAGHEIVPAHIFYVTESARKGV